MIPPTRDRSPRSGQSSRYYTTFWIAIVFVVPFASVNAQDSTTVVAAFDTTKWLAPRQAIELRVHSRASAEKGRIAILAGTKDLSSLFRTTGDTIRYQPDLHPLPSGEQQLTIYSVSANEAWSEIGRFPLRVLTATGFEQADVLPRLTLNVKGQIAEGHSAEAQAPPGSDYRDLVVATGLQTLQRRHGWSLRSQVNLLGASNRQEALRFKELSGTAPKFDLADYQVGIESRGAALTLGQTTYGQQRHLISAFGSRGIEAATRIGRAARVSLAALNGSAIVGWSNPIGLAQSDHRVLGGSFALDLVPRRPGSLQIEGTMVAGSVLPRADFNQGVINDAERSDGSGVRLSMSDPDHRIQIDAGFSRSRSDVPNDTTLAQGLQLTGVVRTARNARYVDASYQVFRAAPISKRLAADLSLSFKHERVDPLFHSVASAVRSDLESDAVDIQGRLGAVAFHGSAGAMRDNLGHIASILTTRTRIRTGTIALPLAALGAGARWLPLVSYDVARTMQAGDGVPPNSEFTPTHVPDQFSRNQNALVEWQRVHWHAGYRLNLTHQDNRQLGRERADFSTSVHNVVLGVTGSSADATFDFGFDGGERKESSEESRTRRVGSTVDWHLTTSTTLTAAFARTVADRADTTVQRVSDSRLELSQRLPVLRLSARSSAGQLFVRFSRQDELLTGALSAPIDRHTWYVSTGLTLGVF